MTCNDVRRWLDEGSPASDRPHMTAHASVCSNCEREIRASLELERMLAIAGPYDVPASFHDAVMREIHTSRTTSPWSPAIDAAIQLSAEPLVPISIGLASVIVTAATLLHDQTLATIANLPPQITAPIAAIVCASSWLLFRLYQRETTFTGG